MSSTVSRTHIDDFTDAIRLTLASDQVQIADLGSYAVDSLLPEIAVTPASLGQLQTVLREAHNTRLSVISHGGGQHLGTGNVPSSYAVALSLSRMDSVIAYEPADLTLTVEPGVMLHRLQAVLGEHGQRLPLDPACSESATIGGVLAANAHGPLRHRYGTARDWLLGLRVVHADGTTTKSGGRVVKNVTGYDLHKLHIGALGTLGVIAEATFKVAPMPRVLRSVSIRCSSPASAVRIALAARDAGLALDAVELLSPTAAHAVLNGTSWALLGEVAGGAQTVERTLRELTSAAAAIGSGIQDRADETWALWRDAFAPEGLSLRISVRPSDVGTTIETLDRQLVGARAMLSATVAAGLIRVQIAEPGARARALVERASQVAARFGGAVVIDAAPAALKREIDVFGPLRPDFEIMRRLKQQFDPDGTLSPGRFAGRL